MGQVSIEGSGKQSESLQCRALRVCCMSESLVQLTKEVDQKQSVPKQSKRERGSKSKAITRPSKRLARARKEHVKLRQDGPMPGPPGVENAS